MSKKRKVHQKEEQAKQLDLEIKEPFKNKFYKAKRQFDTTVLHLEVRKFFKDPLVWAVLVISLVMIASQIFSIEKSFSSMPKLLPIFKYFASAKKELVDKELIYIYPGISILVLVTTLLFVSKNYNREKYLSRLLLVSALVCIVFLSIIMFDLIKI